MVESFIAEYGGAPKLAGKAKAKAKTKPNVRELNQGETLVVRMVHCPYLRGHDLFPS